MLSINTNLSSHIAQNSLKKSTLKLNQAVERMSTGYKINHAKDNAANYSISTDITTKVNAYSIAEENTLMGVDMLAASMDTLSLMSDAGERLRALVIQAQNGTYGKNSLSAIQKEANSITANIKRIMQSAEYNGLSLLNDTSVPMPDTMPKAGEDGFINNSKTYSDAQVAAMTPLASINTFTAGESYSISSVEELIKLSDMVEKGIATTGATFVLANDLDMSSVTDWKPIGNNIHGAQTETKFSGTFDGNGHIISNLKINNGDYYSGLFGCISAATIKNVGLENINMKFKGNSGGLVGFTTDIIGLSAIDNCYTTGEIISQYGGVGGICGNNDAGNNPISNCWSSVDIQGTDGVGGICGFTSTIQNCFSTGNVTGRKNVGGLAGTISTDLTNSYAEGDVKCLTYDKEMYVGGLVGYAYNNGTIKDCIATGNVSIDNKPNNNKVHAAGGLVGYVNGKFTIINSAAYGNVSVAENYGSLIGYVTSTSLTLTNCSVQEKDYSPIGYLNSASVKASLEDSVNIIKAPDYTVNLQVGIYGDESSQISFDTSFNSNISKLLSFKINSPKALDLIDKFLQQVDEKNTMLGSVYNRLESVLENIDTQQDNLVATRSTLKDADIAEVSSEYIKQQILQQASATLLSTANQSPALALQLL